MTLNYRIIYLRQLLKGHNLHHILITDNIDVQYVSGFKASNCLLLVSKRSQRLITDFRYKEAATKFCSNSKVWQFVQIFQQGISCLAPWIKAGQRVGIQDTVMSVSAFDSLRKTFKGTKFVKLGKEISNTALVKEPQEIRAIRKAASIGDQSLMQLVNRIKLGMSEKLVAKMLVDICKENGSEGSPFDTIVLFGSRTALPHGTPSPKKLKQGDFILFDFGCMVKGLCSDMTRTFVYGKAKAKQKELYSIVKDAQKSAVSLAKPNVLGGDIDHAARSIITHAGYGEYFGHATGHGLGLRIHENPRISKCDKMVIKKDMVFTVEPGIYISSFGGVRIEDTIVITNTGSQSLTKTTRELVTL